MTTPASAKRTVIVAVPTAAAIAAGSYVVQNARKGPSNATPPPRIILGAFLATFILTGVADLNPGFAAGFGVLVLVSALTYNGAPILSAITSALR